MHTLKDFGVKKYVGNLDDGTRVVLFQRPHMPVYSRVLFRAGSTYDPIGKEGLSHFAEHMLFRKTKKFPSQYDLTSYIENIGGGFNAFTGLNYMGVDVSLATSEDYSKATNFISEVLFSPSIKKEDFDIEKGIILQEYFDKISNQESWIYNLFLELVYQGTAKNRHIIGSEDSIKRMKVEDIKNFYDYQIPKAKKVIIVAGDIKLENVATLFNKKFSSEVKNVGSTPLKELPIKRKESVKIRKYKDSHQVNMLFGFRTVQFIHRDFIPLEVLSYLVCHGMSSRFMQRLRSEKGLVYGVSVENWGASDSGVWAVNTSTSTKNLQQTLDTITDEFRNIFEGKFSDSELKIAKNKIVKSKIRGMQSSQRWVGFHSEEELEFPEKCLTLDEYLNHVEKVSLEDLIRVGKKYFKPESWYLAVCGDVERKDFKVSY